MTEAAADRAAGPAGDAPGTSPHPPSPAHAERIRFPIVGIGASAGGLEAFTRLLRELPPDTGMAFVLIQHLSPSHPSLLAEILSRSTSMTVTEVSAEPPVRPDHVYVIPPNRVMYISDGHLRLAPRELSPGHQRPIDDFLRSLAQDAQDRAIGVILAGAGSDGTIGLQEIKARGGLTFAQDDSAEVPGMPRSAVISGCVDVVAAPEEIARELSRLARLPLVDEPASPDAHGTEDEGRDVADEEALERILRLLRSEGQPDFTSYKKSGLIRRVRRRMVLQGLATLEAYHQHLDAHPDELLALRSDLLIGVTSFFRNPEDFEFLQRQVIPALTAAHARNEPLRVWCAGCSTGEETYSVAMAFLEASLTGAAPLPLKIFATDVNGASVNKARTGIYSRAIAAAVSPARLQRHFIEVEQGYRVAAPIRELCIFAEHDLLTDPPFSHIDLLVCRNLLIYLDSSLQERVIPVLHGALRPGGDLWLGPSEVPGRHEDRFEREDPRHRFFRRKSEAGRPPGRRHPTEHQAEDPVPRRRDPPGLPGSSAPVADARREADNLLLARYAPPSVLVNAHLDVVQFRGDASPYLAQGAGSGGANLLKMAHAELLVALRNLVERARVEGLPVREERLSFPIGDEQRHVRVEASPIRGPEHFAEHVLVSFEELEPISQASPAGTDADGTAGRPRAAPTGDHKRLLHELAATREYLKSIIEQQLATNQDLQSSSEENQSANEELQSINEELETSKEEVQAANEELTTVNDELRERNAELASSNADFLNLLDSVQISIIMLDRDLRIRRFTPPAEKLLSLIAADIGRPIGDIRITLDVPDLQPLLLDVLTTGAVKELTVRTQSGRWHSLRLHPYQTLQRVTQGVVIVLVDVDPLKTAQEQLRASEERHRLLVDGATGYAIMMLDADGIITSWNAGAQRIFGFPDVEIVGQHVSRLYTPEDRARALSSEELLHARQEAGATHEAWLVRKDGSRFWASGSTTALRAPSGALRGYGKIVRDNTDRKRFEEQLQLHVAELAETDRFRTEFLAMLAHEFRNPLAAVRNATDVLDTAHVPPGVATRAHELMRRQIANMSRMIDDLLDVTRVSHGKIHLHKQVVDLVPVLKNAADVHSAALAERGQTLGLSVPAEPVLVMGDATRLEQAVGNLIHNASKYGHDGGHIWVELEEPPRGAEPAAPETLRVIRVRDDGVGIEPALLSRVFDLFTQADQSLARGRGGLGIGLTLARRLVELHGGTLEATSPGPELGSVFTVRLPTGALILPRAAARPAARRSRGGIPRSVLVVDDNEDAAESLAMLLRLAGHHVHVALGPDQALAALGERFDVALLDIGMPGTNGLELAQAMRSRLGEHCPTLIALTGYGHEEMRHDVKAAGFSQHLLKPADPQLLLDILASVKAG